MRLIKPMRLMLLISPPRPTKPLIKPTMIRQSTKVEDPTRLIMAMMKRLTRLWFSKLPMLLMLTRLRRPMRLG